MKRILVAKDKHYTSYFDASTPALLGAAALYLLKERKENGVYPARENLNSWFGEPREVLDPEWIAALPTEELQRSAYEQRVDAISHNKQRREAEHWMNLCEQAIEKSDGNLAWQALQDRAKYEYEGISLETIVEVS